MKEHSKIPAGRRQGGFTLVEMLVVVAIIAGLLAMTGAMLNPKDAGDATRVGARDLRGMVELAQARAVASGNFTAVLIANKNADSHERYLRFAMVVERVPTSASTEANPVFEWIPVGNGSYFPGGAFYYKEKSFNNAFTGTGTLNFGSAFSTGTNKMDRGDWIGLMFSPQGIPFSDGPLPTNPVFLVTGGFVDGNGSTPVLQVSDSEKRLTEGFMVQRSNGRIIPVENPFEQLTL